MKSDTRGLVEPASKATTSAAGPPQGAHRPLSEGRRSAKRAPMSALRSAFAALVIVGAMYPQVSSAVLVLYNGVDYIEWTVGEPEPSINLGSDWFVAEACGHELTWVYEKFPTLPMRTLSTAASTRRAGVPIAPGENECVIWRGDNARFIADNLRVLGK